LALLLGLDSIVLALGLLVGFGLLVSQFGGFVVCSLVRDLLGHQVQLCWAFIPLVEVSVIVRLSQKTAWVLRCGRQRFGLLLLVAQGVAPLLHVSVHLRVLIQLITALQIQMVIFNL